MPKSKYAPRHATQPPRSHREQPRFASPLERGRRLARLLLRNHITRNHTSARHEYADPPPELLLPAPVELLPANIFEPKDPITKIKHTANLDREQRKARLDQYPLLATAAQVYEQVGADIGEIVGIAYMPRHPLDTSGDERSDISRRRKELTMVYLINPNASASGKRAAKGEPTLLLMGHNHLNWIRQHVADGGKTPMPQLGVDIPVVRPGHPQVLGRDPEAWLPANMSDVRDETNAEVPRNLYSSVSRMQARVEIDDTGTVTVTDTESHNGTNILHGGAELNFGPSELLAPQDPWSHLQIV